MGFKIWCQVGVWVTPFSKLPYSREFLNMRFKSWLFFLLFLKSFTHFLKISKTLFAMQNGVLKFAFETHVHMVLLRIILALKVFQKYRRQRAFFSKCDVKLEVYCNYCGRSFDQAATLSLRGPAQFTHEARSAEFFKGEYKCFIPRRDSAKAATNGVNFDSFHFVVVWERYLTLSKSQPSGGLF